MSNYGNHAKIAFTNTLATAIENPVAELKADFTDISSCVNTLDQQLRQTSEKLEQELTVVRNNGYATLDQIERLVQHQLTTIDALTVGLRTCTQLSTNINNQLNKKIKRLTRLTAVLGLLGIATVLFLLLR